MPEFTPQDFVSKWKRAEARERQEVQEHFLDLCALVGHETPMQSDPTGMRFAFEMGAAKTSGGSGWADVAKLGYFGWEYKSKDADLDKAYEQLLRYRDALQNPPLLIVSDINRIIIRTNYTNLPTRTITLTLDDLLTSEGLKTLKAVFFNPEQFKPHETIESVTKEAAAHFTKLAENLRKYGSQPQEIAHFLIRLLFCLFAEDIGLLPERLFPRLLEQTHHNSKDFSEVLQQLFRAMNKGGYFGADKILYFNGGLFDNDNVLPLDSADMDIIADIDALDWSAIKPSIFGTLFERGLDPSKRSQLGAHYTSEEDILLIVEPVLMQPLRREWEEIKHEIRKIKTEGEQEAKGKKKTELQKKMSVTLRTFADKIAAIKVLDPACGSGNFLYVALRLLLDLQNEVFNFSDEMGAGRPYITVTASQVHGIEINEYAHELAQMTIQIGYIQWLRDNGYGLPKEPILKPAETIQHMDAVLAYDESGKPIEPEWPAVDVIVGNPPFLGSQKMRAELGNNYVDDLRDLFGSRIPGTSDLVCYWFEKARALIENRQAKRAGLLATQGIRGGTNRTVLERIKQSGDIFWAQSDRNWILDGATVHVSMVGFDDRLEKHKELDGRKVASINSDLTSTIHDITKASRLEENFGLCFQGPVKVGAFEIIQDAANKFLRLSNPNGKSNADVIRPWVNGIDITTGYRNMFIIDFGNMTIQEASLYEAPFEYIKRVVKPARDKNNRPRRRDSWWQHGETVPGLRIAIAKNEYFICTPRVSKHRLFVRFSSRTLPDSAVIAIAREDDYFLGVLHSKIHELWARATGTQLREAESGFRYTPTSTFETFPFPWAPGKEPKDDPRVKAIGQAAKELVEQRDRWLNAEGLGEAEKKKRTLTNLYNQRPTWLDLAHKKLDEAVFAAYGWPNDLSDEQILEKLLALNLERAK
jgi:type II restriction/modification system DNA methylase subunit YeeA